MEIDGKECDLVTIALAQAIINVWKDYKKFEKVLGKHLEDRSEKIKEHGVDCFISDIIIGEEVENGEEFEKEFLKFLED